MTDDAAPKASSRARLLLFSLLTTMLFFGAGEVLSRMFFPTNCTSMERFDAYLEAVDSHAPATVQESLHRSAPMPYDPYLIWHLVLNFRGPNLGVEVVHNARGLRSPEIPLTKPAGTSRILLLGDSTVYGHGVDAANMLSTRLEELLQEALPKRTIQVINGGVPGYSSLQSLNQFRRITYRFEPDIVVVANLWSDCVHERFEDKRVIYGDGPMRLVNHTGQWMDELLAPRSALFCLLREILLSDTQRECAGLPPLCAPPPEKLNPNHSAPKEEGFQSIRQPGSDGTSDSQPRVALQDYEDNLTDLVRLVRRHQALPVLVELSTGVELGEFEDEASTLGDYPSYREVMNKVARDTGAPWLALPPAFRSAQQHTTAPLFMDRVHPTALGHEVMAKALTQMLLNEPSARDALEHD